MFYFIGGANYKEEDTKLIDLDILNNSINKRVLFIPLANKDNVDKSIIFKKYYESLGASVDILYILKENLSILDIEQAFITHDIIYFSGGSSKVLVDNAIRLNLKDLIEKYSSNKIICGVSAGAMMMFEYGFSDLDAYMNHGVLYNCKMVKCLGIVEGAFCPHYDQTGYFDFNDEIKKYPISGYACTNGCAIKFDNNQISVIKNLPSYGAYYFDCKNNYIESSLR